MTYIPVYSMCSVCSVCSVCIMFHMFHMFLIFLMFFRMFRMLRMFRMFRMFCMFYMFSIYLYCSTELGYLVSRTALNNGGGQLGQSSIRALGESTRISLDEVKTWKAEQMITSCSVPPWTCQCQPWRFDGGHWFSCCTFIQAATPRSGQIFQRWLYSEGVRVKRWRGGGCNIYRGSF